MKIIDLLRLEVMKAVNMKFPIIVSGYFFVSSIYFFFVFSIMTTTKIWINKSTVDIFIEQNYIGAIIFFAIVALINIGIDYNKMIYAKQYVSGISKYEFIFGKFLFIILFSIILILLELIKFFIIQLLVTNQISIDVKILYKITLSFFVILYITGTYAFLVVTIFKRTIISAVILYLIFKAEQIVEVYENMNSDTGISNFFPFKIVNNLLKNFIMEPIHFIVLFIYFLISVFFITYLLKKGEIRFN